MIDLPGKTMTDRNGNILKLCQKCNVPVFLNGAMITCQNCCYLGEVNWRPEFRDPKPCEKNDYNPVVTKMCPDCRLDGNLYFQDETGWYSQQCATCNGVGSVKERLYADDEEPLPIKVNDEGWTRCPKCNFRFKITDPNVWLGPRHRRCGQRLIVPDNWLLYWP